MVRDQGVKTVLPGRTDAFALKAGMPCHRGGCKSRVFRMNEKATQSGRKLHCDLAIIFYYRQTSLVKQGNKPLSTKVCERRVSSQDEEGHLKRQGQVERKGGAENWLVQLGWLTRMAQALDWLLLAGVPHSRKELVIIWKKAFFKLFKSF